MSGNAFLSQVCLRVCVLFVAFFLVISSASASSIKQLGINEMLVDAELIFQGSVISSEPRWNASKTLIKTYITFEVAEVISGEYQSSTLELSFVGGSIGENVVEAEGLRRPEVGEKGVYFVSSTTVSMVNPLVGWSQGHFLIEKDESGADMVMTDEHVGIVEISESTPLITTTRSPVVVSDGVARDVVIQKGGSRVSRMTANAFKQELKRRMRSLNK